MASNDPHNTGEAVAMTAIVVRHHAPSGNRDHDYFQPMCSACGWHGATYSNRTIEGSTLAARDARGHVCRTEGSAQ